VQTAVCVPLEGGSLVERKRCGSAMAGGRGAGVLLRGLIRVWAATTWDAMGSSGKFGDRWQIMREQARSIRVAMGEEALFGILTSHHAQVSSSTTIRPSTATAPAGHKFATWSTLKLTAPTTMSPLLAISQGTRRS